MTIFEDFITVDMLQSFPGMVIMVAILTQFSKTFIDNFFKTRTKFIVYLYSLGLNFFTSYTKGFEGDILTIIVMNILNSAIIALAAMKAYESIGGEKKRHHGKNQI